MSRPRRARAPWFLAVPGAVALAFLLIPLIALLAQAPWASLGGIVTSEAARSALLLSLVTSLSATAFAALVGVPLAWLLAREVLPWTGLLRALVLVPLLLPPVVAGVALLAALGRRGLVGQVLSDAFGIQFPFTTAGVVIAEAFVSMPFLIITMEGGFRSLSQRYEEAAATLGASAWTVFRRITMPMVGPSLIAGLVLCWARALGEFGATITFAGSFPGVTQTMPLAVYAALETDRSVAIALSVVLLAVSVSVLVALRGRYLRAQAS
ncbi:MAG: ABC transporter permease [Actinomycetales bacterium]|nr:ABC transporter permease [Actinomycetales bacterium]